MFLEQIESEVSFMKSRIVELENEIQRFKGMDKPSPVANDDIYVRTTKLLREMQMPPHILGYYYIRTAIELISKDETLLQAITKELNPTIAKIHKTTASRVDRAMRHAIETVWNKPSITNMGHVFGGVVFCDKPTNSEFLATVVDYLKTNERVLAK